MGEEGESSFRFPFSPFAKIVKSIEVTLRMSAGGSYPDTIALTEIIRNVHSVNEISTGNYVH